MEGLLYEICPYDTIRTQMPAFWNFADNASSNNLICICAKDGTILLGVLIAECLSKNKHLALRFIYVIPEFRHKGVGTQMWNKLLSVTVSMRCCYASFIEEAENSLISFFLKSLGFTYLCIDCSGFKVKKDTWLSVVYPRISITENSFSYYYKSGKELDVEDKKKIKIATEREQIPAYLNPLTLNAPIENIITFFSTNGDIIGWCVFSIINVNTVHIICIYILQTHRNLKNIFYLLSLMTDIIICKYPELKQILFYYDYKNELLGLFYKRLLRDSFAQSFNRITYEYKISIL